MLEFSIIGALLVGVIIAVIIFDSLLDKIEEDEENGKNK